MESSNGRPDSAERKPCLESRSPLGDVSVAPPPQHSSQLREILRTPMSHAESSQLGLCEPNMRKRSNTDTLISLSTMSSANHHHHSSSSFASSVGDASPAKTANILQQQTSAATNEEVLLNSRHFSPPYPFTVFSFRVNVCIW